MWFILDLGIIAIVALFAFLSARKGFIKTFVEIFGLVLVLLLANKLSPTLSNFTYNKYVEPAVVNSLQDIKIEDGVVKLPEGVLPEFVNKFLGEGFNLSGFEQEINQNLSDSLNSAVTVASENIIKPVVTEVLSLAFNILITMVLMFVVNILAGILDKVLGGKVLGKINKISGAVLGMIKGVAIAVIVCSIISAIVTLSKTGIGIFTPANIDKTIIFKLLILSL